jgi:hypothetical protein
VQSYQNAKTDGHTFPVACRADQLRHLLTSQNEKTSYTHADEHIDTEIAGMQNSHGKMPDSQI